MIHLTGIGKGFEDLHKMGLIDRLPRLYGVQAEGSSVLHRAHHDGHLTPNPDANTYADSICVGEPRVVSQALARVRKSHGCFLVVSDNQIREAQLQLARNTGIFAEPAAATAVAGLEPALQNGLIGPDENVVTVITGHGLKDVRGAMSAVAHHPHRISKDTSSLESTLRELNLGPR